MQASATDFQLLSDFAADGDETAFATIVHRHGAMIRGVGRRILGDPAGADDAFQATFIALARHAKSLAGVEQNTDSLGSWLYRVAVNAALQQKRKAKSRRRCETTFAEQRQTELRERAAREEWLPVLDEEIGALPDRYQSPLVLCHLEGRTQQDAADELGLTYATIRRRLKQAKILLRERLARRGLSEAGLLVLPLLAQAAALATAPAEAAIQAVTTAALSPSVATSATSTVVASSGAASSTAATAGAVPAAGGGLTALLSGKSTAVLTLTVLGGLTAGLCAATLAWDAPSERLAARRTAEPDLPRSPVTAPAPAEVAAPTVAPTMAPAADGSPGADAAPTEGVADLQTAPIDFEPLPSLPESPAVAVQPPRVPVDDPEIRLASAITPERLAKNAAETEPAAAQDDPAPTDPKTTARSAAVSGVIEVLNQQREQIARGPQEPPARRSVGEPRVFKGTVSLQGRAQRFYTVEQADALLGWLEQQPAPPADGFRAAFHIDGLTFEVRDFGLALDVLREKRPLD